MLHVLVRSQTSKELVNAQLIVLTYMYMYVYMYMRMSSYGCRGKFGEHKRSVRVAERVAWSNPEIFTLMAS